MKRYKLKIGMKIRLPEIQNCGQPHSDICEITSFSKTDDGRIVAHWKADCTDHIGFGTAYGGSFIEDITEII